LTTSSDSEDLDDSKVTSKQTWKVRVYANFLNKNFSIISDE
jgi:hypothetical protein